MATRSHEENAVRMTSELYRMREAANKVDLIRAMIMCMQMAASHDHAFGIMFFGAAFVELHEMKGTGNHG